MKGCEAQYIVKKGDILWNTHATITTTRCRLLAVQERSDGMEMEEGLVPCCTKPKLRPAFVWFPVFKGHYCLNCYVLTLTCNKFLAWFFEFFLAPFWPGTVWVAPEDGDSIPPPY